MLSAKASSSFLLRLTPKGTISLPAIGTWEENFYAAGDERLVGMTLEASRGSFIYGGDMCSRDQDLSIMALVMIDDRMTQKSREFY